VKKARIKKVVPIANAREVWLYGSKAVGLGDATRKGGPTARSKTVTRE
jgi:hypothetical protein